LALDRLERPHIAYWNAATKAVKYAVYGQVTQVQVPLVLRPAW
jgi:hypothetical protein